MKDGLVSNGVNELFQDSRGFMWIGTGDGISVYDGYEFRNYSEAGGRSIGMVTALLESKAFPGTVWIGSLGTGLNKFQGGLIVAKADSVFQQWPILALVEDQNGALWCGTERGVYILDSSKGSTPELIVDDFIRDVAEDRDRRIWVATQSGVTVFSRDGGKYSGTRLSRPGSGINQLLPRADGGIWMATEQCSLLRFRDTTLVASRHIPDQQVYAMSEDSHGKLWLCTAAGALARVPFEGNEEHEILTTVNGLAGSTLTVFVDREDNVWVGLRGAGLQKLSNQDVTIFPIESLPLGLLYQPPMTSDSTGRFWAIATTGILEVVPDSRGRSILFHHSISTLGLNARPKSVQFAPSGTLLVEDLAGTIHEFAVARRRSGQSALRTLRRFSPGKGMINMFVVDRQGNFWCNLVGAVVVLDKSLHPVRTLTEADGLPSTNIKAMFLDAGNTMWLGSVSVISIPAAEIRSAKPVRHKILEGVDNEGIRSINQDSEGRMIFGTRFNGLAFYQDGLVAHLRTANGLLNNCVWSIARDGTDHIWICTQVGLQRISTKTLLPERGMVALGSDGTIDRKSVV